MDPILSVFFLSFRVGRDGHVSKKNPPTANKKKEGSVEGVFAGRFSAPGAEGEAMRYLYMLLLV